VQASVVSSQNSATVAPLAEVSELGLFGAMALLAMLQAGADPGYRYLRRLGTRGVRIAPHRALRHQIVVALMEAGVIAPTAGRKLRLDATLADPGWEEDSLEDADWSIVWSDITRNTLPTRLKDYLDEVSLTPHNREVLVDAWLALATAECLAFGEHALATHRMNPAIALAAAPVLGPILAQRSIGRCCALMWWAAKNVASSFRGMVANQVWRNERSYVLLLTPMIGPTFLDTLSSSGTTRFLRAHSPRPFCSPAGWVSRTGLHRSVRRHWNESA
jgi:hypothetical protein